MKKKKHTILVNTRGDIIGGVTASLVSLPESIAFGILAISPLGPKYIPLGVIIGLISQAFMNIGPAPFVGARIMISGPSSLAALMIASILTMLLKTTSDIPHVLTLVFLVIFMAGIFQILFGALKLGDLAKYIPYPVISGLLNGTALLILYSQLRPALGLPEEISFLDGGKILSIMEPFTLIITLITISAFLLGEKIVKKIPAPFLGIFAGTLAYFAIEYFSPGKAMGPLVGKITGNIGYPDNILKFKEVIISKKYLDQVLDLVPYSAGIAVVISLKSLISIVSVDNFFMVRSNSNREILGQGVGNLLAASFGGIAGAGNITTSIASHKYGSRTPVSRLITGIFTIIIIIYLRPYVSQLPKVVLSGLLIVLSFSIFDQWIFQQIAVLFSKEGEYRRWDTFLNILLVPFVTFVMLVIGIFEAVGVGLAASILIFMLQMGKDIVRRQFSGTKMRSNVERPRKELVLLEKHGFKIRIFELEGSLFFGTADKISSVISQLSPKRIEYIILDFRGINQFDSTGIHLMSQIRDRCKKNGQKLLFSSLKENVISFGNICAAKNCFDNMEDAMAWAEDRIIDKFILEKDRNREIMLNEIDSLSTLSKSEFEFFGRYLKRVSYKKGRIIFKQGDPGDNVFFIVKGRADIFIGMKNEKTRKRLSTLCPGTIFGEMAVIDNQKRAAGVISNTEMVCYTLSDKKLESLEKNHPKIGHKVLAGITKELSKRIRINIAMISQLKTR